MQHRGNNPALPHARKIRQVLTARKAVALTVANAPEVKERHAQGTSRKLQYKPPSSDRWHVTSRRLPLDVRLATEAPLPVPTVRLTEDG